MLTLSLDGLEVAHGRLGSLSKGNRLPVEIGRNSAGAGKYLRGQLDDVRIWNVVRSPLDIAANYKTQLTDTQLGLVANWYFDDGVGALAVDSSANHHDAGLTGGAAFSTEHH